MKVDIKVPLQNVQKNVKNIVKNRQVSEKVFPKRILSTPWNTLERYAENMPPQEYIAARRYLSSLERLGMLDK